MLEQNTPEWEAMRKDKVGASDAPVIMEVSPYKTPYQLWQEKLNLATNKQTFAMARGHEMEPLALRELEKQTGLLFRPMVKVHAELTWMMASLDAVDVDGQTIAEIKCPGQVDHQQAVAGNVPEKYFPQLQHQMEVAQVDFAYYFSFDGTNGVLLKLYRDDKYIKNLISKEREFWECVQDLVAPRLNSRDYVEQTDEKWLQLASKWQTLNRTMSMLESEEKELRDELILLSNNQNSSGGGIKLSKQIRKGNVDYSKIQEIKNINLDVYRKAPVEYWKIIGA